MVWTKEKVIRHWQVIGNKLNEGVRDDGAR